MIFCELFNDICITNIGFWCVQLENVWGHVNIIGRGRGQALIQSEYAYGVDYEPLKEAPPAEFFTLVVNERYKKFRNITEIDVQLCPR
jgi:hypothetical protein